MTKSLFIKAMHPKTEIRPTREAIQKILDAGWVAQTKIHGHRAQIHISADPDDTPLIYNRLGQKHAKPISAKLVSEIKRLFKPEEGWNVVDAEWTKSDDRFYVFDFLKEEGRVLRTLNYEQRWGRLPRSYISPHVTTLPIIRSVEKCMEVLKSPDPKVEGLVFKSVSSPGFRDTSIIRCRKRLIQA